MAAARTLHGLRTSLWLVPALCVVAGIVVSIGTIALDRWLGFDLLPSQLVGGPDAALAILSTIATSMVTLAALVLTITMVVVQLAMGQFSPRIVRTILQDTTSQLAIGLFVGTFAHAMLTMREIRFAQGAGVPGIAILTAFVLVIASIILLVYYVHHLGQSLRVAALIELVGDRMRELVDRNFGPDTDAGEDAPRGTLAAPRSGVIFEVDHEDLVEAARDADCVIELIPPLGDFVPAGSMLARVSPADAPVDPERVTGAVRLGPERTMDQDLAYGLRMLVDIAERSVSEPFLDPTTSVQAIDRMHDCLRQLVRREFPDGRHHDAQGRLRLVEPTMEWEGFVALAFDEMIEAGRLSPQIPRRLLAALEDLLELAPPDRRPPLEERLRRVRERAEQDGIVADQQGIGSGAEVASASGSSGR
jgi:uncharacterized membrane protein